MDALKKLFLAAVGGTTLTYETANDTLKKLIAKGQISVDEGKVLSQDLKRYVSKKTGAMASEKADENTDQFLLMQQEIKALAQEVQRLSQEVAALKQTPNEME